MSEVTLNRVVPHNIAAVDVLDLSMKVTMHKRAAIGASVSDVQALGSAVRLLVKLNSQVALLLLEMDRLPPMPSEYARRLHSDLRAEFVRMGHIADEVSHAVA